MDYFVLGRNESQRSRYKRHLHRNLFPNLKVGQYTLPDNVLIVAAGNREADKGVTYRMSVRLATDLYTWN